ncbi:hypothetical protein CCZ01_09780, partial [Helicobacter monodelphidis]|uniref:hypothetical protein n=1 Tax=Helicobacter sp. 15-1451 TaxID=2004995 RepID=UPI000DCC1BEC
GTYTDSWGYQAIKIDNNSTSATLTLNGNVAADKFEITSAGANLRTLTINGDLKYSSASNYDVDATTRDEVSIDLKDATLGTNIKLGGLKVGQGTVQITGSQGLDTIELAKGINMDRINLIGYTPAGSAKNATTATATTAFTGVGSAGTTSAVTKTLTFTVGTTTVEISATAPTGKTITATEIGTVVVNVLNGSALTQPAAGTVTVTVGGVAYPATGGTDLLTGWTASQAAGKLTLTPDNATTTILTGKIGFTGDLAGTTNSITYTGYIPANPAKNGTSYVNGLISKTGADSKAHYDIDGNFIDVVKNFQLKYDNVAYTGAKDLASSAGLATADALYNFIRFTGTTGSGASALAKNGGNTDVFTIRTNLTTEQQTAANAITLGDMIYAA